MHRTLLVFVAFTALLLAPTRSASAQRLAPSGVQRRSVAPVAGTMDADTSASSGRPRGRRIARGSLIGFGVGALAGAGVFGAAYIAFANSGRAHTPETDIIIGLGFTGAGALIGTMVGGVVAATSGD